MSKREPSYTVTDSGVKISHTGLWAECSVHEGELHPVSESGFREMANGEIRVQARCSATRNDGGSKQ